MTGLTNLKGVEFDLFHEVTSWNWYTIAINQYWPFQM